MSKLFHLKKINSAFKKINKKVILLQDLSLATNINEELILDALVDFEPMIRMIPDYNFRNLESSLKDYLNSLKEKNEQGKTRKSKRAKKVKFESVSDFILKKMVLPGGIIDKAYVFSDTDLKEIRKLANAELKKRKNK